MKKIIIILILFSFAPINGEAECGPEVSLDSEWEETVAIFIGKVISVTESPIYDVYGKKLDYVTIKISKVFKWDCIEMYSDTTTFFQVNIECFKFRKDMEYLIFANRFDNTFFNASVCSRTCLLNKAQDIISLLEKKIQQKKNPDRKYLESLVPYL